MPMEVIFVIVCLGILLISIMSVVSLIGGVLILLYGKYYWREVDADWPAFRDWSGWTYVFADFLCPFNLRVQSPDDLRAATEAGKRLFYVGHPHGVATSSAIAGFLAYHWTHTCPDARVLQLRQTRTGGSSTLFLFPGLKELAEWAGVFNVTRANLCKYIQQHEKHVLIHPGGVNEMLLSAPDEERADLETHQGFLRLLFEELRKDAVLVPVYYENEHKRFWTWHPFPVVSRWLVRAWRIPAGFFWWPRFRRVHTIVHVCKPIDPEKYARFEDFRQAYLERYTAFGFAKQETSSRTNIAPFVYVKQNPPTCETADTHTRTNANKKITKRVHTPSS